MLQLRELYQSKQDGDPSTIWHTMYSVTIAKYPHWVDLDAGEVKEIKGFTYLPRQKDVYKRQQCAYAPEYASHSASMTVEVK